MNRRNFLTTGALGLSSVSILPASIISNKQIVSLADFGKGFYSLYKRTNQIYVKSLSGTFLKAHKKMVMNLNNKGYVFNEMEVIGLSQNCFILPLNKTSILGYKSKELALIIKEQGSFSHYILNQYHSMGFNKFIEDLDENIKFLKLDINVLEFITPVKVNKESFGRVSIFAFENTYKNNIILKSSSKNQLVSIS